MLGAIVAILVILLLVALVVTFLVVVPRYNELRRLHNAVQRERADVDVQLCRRHDLLDNLAGLVTAFAVHERSTLTSTVQLRVGQQTSNGRGEALESQSLLALAERYPDLKSSPNFLQLALDLADTENKIANQRHRLNEAVKLFTDGLKTLPNAILFSRLFSDEEYFSIPTNIGEPVSLKLGLPQENKRAT